MAAIGHNRDESMSEKNHTIALPLGAALAGLGIALGAFGAHGLRSIADAASVEVFETGVRYQLYHSFALMVIGLLAGSGKGTTGALRWAAILFLLGIALFSGSLYVLALSGVHWIGIITPFGGMAFLAGWASLVFALRRPRMEPG
jgi:uncharacterized membrane protein YgdD (TMEM256/DUF423 family)